MPEIPPKPATAADNRLVLLAPPLQVRIAAYLIAISFLIADQWTKQWAVDSLANPVHPMIVAGDGERTAAELFAARGVEGDELARAMERRTVWRLSPAVGLRSDLPLAEAPPQLFVLRGAGLPMPRRLRNGPDAGTEQTLGARIENDWRVPLAEQAALFRDGVLRADGVWTDAGAKLPASAHLALLEREIDVVDGFMRYVYAENPGAAWSLLRDAPVDFRTTFFLLVSGLASLAMIWAIWVGWMGTRAGTLALGGVLGGAVGNLIDRGRFTVVVDFVLNYVGDLRWPVWNVADAGITVGMVAILLELLLGMRRGGREAPVTTAEADAARRAAGAATDGAAAVTGGGPSDPAARER